MEHDIAKQARRAAALKKGWIIHVAVFTLVNAGLWLAGHRGHYWLGLPTGGWIIGLAIHTAVVWLYPLCQGFYERLVQRERDRLGRR